MTRRTQPLGLVAAVGVVGLIVGALIAPDDWDLSTLFAKEHAAPRTVSERSHPLTGQELSTIALFEQTAPSVVFIMTSHERATGDPVAVAADESDPAFDPSADGDFDWDSGSGFVWDEQGHIVTNWHVVRNSIELTVRLPDLSDWPGRLVGFDEDKDLAVLAIEAPPHRLAPIVVGNSARLKVGQRAYSIGNPFGLSSTLTEGIISAVGRTIRSGTGAGRIIQDVIQTDAAINPGNSGGPLLDSSGRLVGVNTAIYSPSGAYAGIGFAVPVDTVDRIIPQLVEHGRVIRPGLGIIPFDDSVTKRNNLAGVLIRVVENDSAAAAAGLRGTRYDRRNRVLLGDLIIAIDDNPIRSLNDLFLNLDKYEVGDEIRVKILRDGDEHELTTALKALRDEPR